MKFNEVLQKYLNESNTEEIKDNILDFFNDNPNPSDSEVHQWAEDNSMDKHKLEELIYELLTEYVKFLKGGRWNEKGTPEVDQEELKKGIEIEYEHTSNQEDAKRIALDHLSEIPDYYTRLIKMEEEAGIDMNNKDTEDEI